LHNLDGGGTIVDSTIDSNQTNTQGGGLWHGQSVVTSTLSITNVTLSGNIGTEGGGLYQGGGQLRLAHTTISSNTTTVLTTTGGGIQVGAGVLTLTHTIVANSGLGGDCGFGAGTIFSLNYNLSGDTSCSTFTAPNDITNTNPFLDPLQNYGGSTTTHRPQAGSPVINAGNPAFAPPPSLDQRGFPRVISATIDIGAYEAP
jgi:hypothetical protein